MCLPLESLGTAFVISGYWRAPGVVARRILSPNDARNAPLTVKAFLSPHRAGLITRASNPPESGEEDIGNARTVEPPVRGCGDQTSGVVITTHMVTVEHGGPGHEEFIGSNLPNGTVRRRHIPPRAALLVG
jgi:hypothetical protein